MPVKTGPLDPHNRRLLFEALRPPAGYELDFAVGTTFSLDLTALAVVPLAFTPFADEAAGDSNRSLPDPLALLEGLRRNSRRVAIFCQAGQIAIPRQRSRLLGFLEDCVCEVRARRKGGVFHPKIWLLRFESATRPPLFRLLCLSRNLTFDRSWDTVLMLEGELDTVRRRGFGVNNPLGDFIAELPNLATGEVPARIQEGVARLASEVRRVRFLPPAGFDDFAFHPLGLGNAHPFPPGETGSRALVVSPFLARDTLTRLAAAGRRHVLVSRPDALGELAAAGGAPKSFERLFTLDEGAEPEPDEEPAENGEEAIEAAESALDAPLAGLHAKLYVVEEGTSARVLTGSANATEAAFNRNVEFLIELKGPRKTCGVDAFLGCTDETTKGVTSLADLLRPWSPPTNPTAPDPTRRKLEQLIEKGRIEIASAGLGLAATPAANDAYLLILQPGAATLSLGTGLSVRVWPILQRESAAVALQLPFEAPLPLGLSSPDSITAFLAIELTASTAGQRLTARFVLKLPLSGAPDDRQERILRSLLNSRGQVLRFLAMLLAGDDDAGISALGTSGFGDVTGFGSSDRFAAFPVFESLVRTVSRSPERLDAVARVLKDLIATPDGERLLPDGFLDVWEPLWEARQNIARLASDPKRGTHHSTDGQSEAHR